MRMLPRLPRNLYILLAIGLIAPAAALASTSTPATSQPLPFTREPLKPAVGAPAPGQSGSTVTVASRTYDRVHDRVTIEIAGVKVPGVSQVIVDNSSPLPTDRGMNSAPISPSAPRPAVPCRLVVTREWSNSPDWVNWRKQVLDGKTDRRSVSVIFHDQSGAETSRLKFTNCSPTKHTLPDFAARNSGHAVETIELEGVPPAK
ncbi:MAG: phage tail protein [Opitutales bacterium]